MTSVTVGDLLRLIAPERLRIMAGRAGLGREVRWVTSLRATPPYLAHLNGGELVLMLSSTLRSIGSPLNATQIVAALAERGAAAAVIDRLETDLIDAADRVHLPLLLTEPGSGIDLENELNRRINERLNHLYTVSTSVGRRFAELSAGGGIATIFEQTAIILEKLVLWEDTSFTTLMAVPPPGQPLTFPPPQPPLGLLEGGHQPGRPDSGGVIETPPGPDGYRRLLAHVLTNGQARGYVSAVIEAGEFTDTDRVVVQRAAEACSVELLRSPSQRRDESSAIESLLSELLLGNYGSEAALVGRARYLGIPLEQPHLVVVLEFADTTRSTTLQRDEAARLLALELRGRLAEALMVRELEPVAVLLVPLGEAADEPDRLRRTLADLARRVGARLEPAAELMLGFGGRHEGLSGYLQAYQEALFAVRVGVALALASPVDFADMGFYRLLFALRNSQEPLHFRDRILGSLLDYDRRRNSDMIETLEAYFGSGGNVVEAADHLHVHRNSLAYRLRRVNEITGYDLHQPEELFLLQLALKIHRVLEVGFGDRLGLPA